MGKGSDPLSVTIFLWEQKSRQFATLCSADSSGRGGYDMYDFSGVSSDLAILRSQLFTLNVGETLYIPGSWSYSIKNNKGT